MASAVEISLGDLATADLAPVPSASLTSFPVAWVEILAVRLASVAVDESVAATLADPILEAPSARTGDLTGLVGDSGGAVVALVSLDLNNAGEPPPIAAASPLAVTAKESMALLVGLALVPCAAFLGSSSLSVPVLPPSSTPAAIRDFNRELKRVRAEEALVADKRELGALREGWGGMLITQES